MKRPAIDQQIVFLHTSDLAATSRFYEDVMGLALVLDQGDCRIYRTSADAYVGFCRRQAAPEGSIGLIVTLVTSQVDAWYDYLSRQGVTFETPPALNPKYGIYHCFLRDPNGYLIEIQRFEDPEWTAAAAGSETN